MVKYGSITGKLPIQPNPRFIIKKNQTKKLYIGLNKLLLIMWCLQIKGRNKIDTILAPIKKIPNNLFVTDLNIAYKGKKYHSGNMSWRNQWISYIKIIWMTQHIWCQYYKTQKYN